MTTQELVGYARVGSNEYVRCVPGTEPTGFIRVLTPPPLDGLGTYICDTTGNWTIPDENYVDNYNDNIIVQRQLAYLKVAPIEVQLEAIFEDRLGNSTKLESITEKFHAIRQKYPKI